MVVQAQPNTATYKALNPRWLQTDELDFLRQIEHEQRILIWQQTKDGHKGVNAPEPHLWPWEKEELDEARGVIKGDSVSWDEAARRLGWTLPDPDHDEHRAFKED